MATTSNAASTNRNEPAPSHSPVADQAVVTAPETSDVGRLCTLADSSFETSASWRSLAVEIYTGASDGSEEACRNLYLNGTITRKKMWETTHIAYGLRSLGLLNEQTTALGVGCGVEPLLFFLARHTARLYATDLYGFGWVTAPLEMLHDPTQFAPYAYPKERLTILQMNGMGLIMPNDAVDFVYSISTIEHFGGPRAALAHVKEAERILKPGGVLAFSTEYILKSGYTQEADFCFNRTTLDWLVLNSGMELVAPMFLTPASELVNDPAEILLPEWTIAPDQFNRLSSRLGESIFTDVTLFLRKTRPAS